MLGNTLLLVDDNGAWLNTVSAFFRPLKFNVHTAGTCADAIRLAEELRPDYVLLDFHLKGEDAAKVCRHIRSREELKKTNLLIVSGDETIRVRAYRECQADHFILKCPPDEILAVIESLKRRIYWDKGIEEYGDLCLKRSSLQVFLDSKPVLKLASEERFNLLTALVSQSPAFLDSEALAERLYGEDFPPEKLESVRVFVHRLKNDLGPLGDRIHNNRGEGWAYISPDQQTSQTKNKPFLKNLASLLPFKKGKVTPL